MARILADLMGSDKGLNTVLEGALRASTEGIEVVLVGDRERILAANPEAERLQIVHASQEITMIPSLFATARTLEGTEGTVTSPAIFNCTASLQGPSVDPMARTL